MFRSYDRVHPSPRALTALLALCTLGCAAACSGDDASPQTGAASAPAIAPGAVPPAAPGSPAVPAASSGNVQAGSSAAPPASPAQAGAPKPPAGTAVEPGQAGATAGGAGSTGSAATSEGARKNECDAAGAYEPLVPRDGETCYEFRTHGQSAPGDESKFDVPPDESYNQFYFDVPWPAGSVATRFGARFDNLKVLHHWLAFASDANVPAGTVQRNVTGTTLGENAELIGGWAVGGCNVEFPSHMGLRLRSTGKIMLQWHHYNSTGAPAQDGTAIQFCVVPESQRKDIGSVTWLGSENIAVAPGQKSETFGTCENDSQCPITIVAFWPHMHEIGVNMRSEVMRAGEGAWKEVFNEPFSFDYQVHYRQDPALVLQPGDRIRSTCTFMNTTSAPVGFGQSTKAEMCYQFAYSYPEGALNNGVLSLIGATNTCWQFGE